MGFLDRRHRRKKEVKSEEEKQEKVKASSPLKQMGESVQEKESQRACLCPKCFPTRENLTPHDTADLYKIHKQHNTHNNTPMRQQAF